MAILVRNNPLALVDPMGLCHMGADNVAYDDEPGDCGGGSVTVMASPSPDVMPIFVSLPSLLSDTQQPVPTAPPPAVTEAGVGVRPINTGTLVSKQQACIDSFYDSTLGRVIEFGSVLSMLPGWGTNPRKSAFENILLTGGKLVALKSLSKVASNQVIPSVVTGVSVSVASPLERLISAAAGKILGFVERAAPISVGSATVADIMAHGTCAMRADPSLADTGLQSLP